MGAAGYPENSSPFRPLEGVRVLAFEVAYSLPAGTRTLAELGAEVVRVAGPARDSYYISVVDGVYLSKECVGINLKHPEGLRIARELASQADVVCSNFVPGVMERLGLGPAELMRADPRLIVLQLSGYGAPGPWAEYPAFGPSTEAAGGMNQLVGDPGGPPVRVGSGVFSDQLGGRFAALALVAALEARRRTGRGRYIDLSMAEAISTLVGQTVLGASLGERPGRNGNRDRTFAPQGVYRCAGEDDWVAISVKDDAQWRALSGLIGGALAADAELAGVDARRSRHDEIDEAVEVWTATRDRHELEALLQGHGVAAAAVQKSRDSLFDAHLAARGLFQSVEHRRPVLGYAAHPHPTTPWTADGGARHELRELQFHGDGNAAVLERWLGLDEAGVRALEEQGALIAPVDVVVEDRMTSYRDDDHGLELGLPPAGGAE